MRINNRMTDSPFKYWDIGLARAMLMRTIQDLMDKEYGRKARRYIETNDYDYPLSFNNQCEVLNLNPRHVRKALLSGNVKEILDRLSGPDNINRNYYPPYEES